MLKRVSESRWGRSDLEWPDVVPAGMLQQPGDGRVPLDGCGDGRSQGQVADGHLQLPSLRSQQTPKPQYRLAVVPQSRAEHAAPEVDCRCLLDWDLEHLVGPHGGQPLLIDPDRAARP